jgi:subtilisin family serine protease
VSLPEALRAELALLPTRELAPVDVAVLDTGIDATHPDLAGRVIESFEIAVDEEGRHRAAATPLAADNDAYGHGTGVASVIAAVAPNARIVDVRILGADDVETGAALLAGFQLAVLRRFRLVNLSLACHAGFLAPLTELCEQAYVQGQVVVAARRNTPLLEYGLPARLSSCIGVDSDRFPSPYAFRFRKGSPIECIARGEDVPVAAPGGKYTLQNGTSFATPAVTGLCALLLGAHPGLTPYELKSVLKHLAA